MKETCYYQGVEVEFLGIFQYSKVIGESPFIGGPPGGTIAYPVAVIKKDGSLHEVSINNLKFEIEEDAKLKDVEEFKRYVDYHTQGSDSPMYGR